MPLTKSLLKKEEKMSDCQICALQGNKILMLLEHKRHPIYKEASECIIRVSIDYFFKAANTISVTKSGNLYF